MADEKKVEQPNITFTMEMLTAILDKQAQQNAEQLKTVIEELKKPTVLEQKALDAAAKKIETDQVERADNAQGMLNKMKNMRLAQQNCSHKHPDGKTHCVHVKETTGPGYILCQKLQCIVRPEPAPANYNGNHIYSTRLWNELFQTLPTGEMFS